MKKLFILLAIVLLALCGGCKDHDKDMVLETYFESPDGVIVVSIRHDGYQSKTAAIWKYKQQLDDFDRALERVYHGNEEVDEVIENIADSFEEGEE